MIKIISQLKAWLQMAGVDLSDVAITVHLKRDRDAYALHARMSIENADAGVLTSPVIPGRYMWIAGIQVEVKVDALQRDLNL